MSNHTIKAKRKADGEIFNYHKGYYDNDTLYWIYDETTSVISEQEFNDLFEVVEDEKCSSSVADSVVAQPKFKVGDRVKINSKDCVYGYAGKIGTITYTDSTQSDVRVTDNHVVNYDNDKLELIPQTDTLKKEDLNGNFDFEFMINGSNIEEAKKELSKDIQKLITQEIAKAKEDERDIFREDIKLLKNIHSMELDALSLKSLEDFIT